MKNQQSSSKKEEQQQYKTRKTLKIPEVLEARIAPYLGSDPSSISA